jgi:anthranilate phosphoribosyltransferase
MKIEKEQRVSRADVAHIRLIGYPYQQERDGEVVDCSQVLERLAERTGYRSQVRESLMRHEHDLKPLLEGGYYGLDRRMKKGESLSYEEAFSLMTFVSMGVNNAVYEELSGSVSVGAMDRETLMYQSVALLSAMSAKEAYVGLTAEEIAGMVASVLEIDTIVRVPAPGGVIGVGGMGGDRGYKTNGDNSKLFSLSTMGAVMMSDHYFVHKHHSYPNTSKVAGQSAIEAFGARSDQSSADAFAYLQEGGLLMTSCHTTRLIHTLSHRLKGETINHVVGPLSIPVDREVPISGFIGVNDNVHPETIIKALVILQERGVQNYGNSVAFCGLNTDGSDRRVLSETEYLANPELRAQVAIDEVAPPPYPTMASFMVDGRNMGSFLITVDDFLTPDLKSQVHLSGLLIKNEPEAIIEANQTALSGHDTDKAIYLSMTTALSIFTIKYAGERDAFDMRKRRVNAKYLQLAMGEALDTIYSGRAMSRLVDYVERSQASCQI